MTALQNGSDVRGIAIETTENQSLEERSVTLKQPAEMQEGRFKLETPDYQRLGKQVIADLAQL